jgi:hypothetical protein
MSNRSPASDPSRIRQPVSPYDRFLNRATIAWLDALPRDFAPRSIATQFPRIANRLARFWDSPKAIDDYFEQLLHDKRGRRKGFPKDVLEELFRLDHYQRSLRGEKESTDRWEGIPQRPSRADR